WTSRLLSSAANSPSVPKTTTGRYFERSRLSTKTSSARSAPLKKGAHATYKMVVGSRPAIEVNGDVNAFSARAKQAKRGTASVCFERPTREGTNTLSASSLLNERNLPAVFHFLLPRTCQD